MPTINDSQPVSIRLENDQIDHLKLVARYKSVTLGKKVTYADLIRDSISSAYPELRDPGKLDPITRICRVQVINGAERLARTHADACIISEVRSRHPVGFTHAVSLTEYASAARELGLYVIPYSSLVQHLGREEETAHCVLLSRQETLNKEQMEAAIR